MNISQGSRVSIEYTLTLENKEVIDTNKGASPLTFICGNNQIISGLEDAIMGMKAGETKKILIEPEKAYGPILKDSIIEVSREHLPPDAWKIGTQLQGQGAEGQVVAGYVVALKGNKASVDFNHPLAGKILHFVVKILEVQ